MKTELTVFAFDSHAVRCIEKDGEPWFVAADIAEILGYRKGPDMIRMLDEDEKGAHIVRTLGGDQEVAIISESGLYACILKSRREEAKVFRKWVTAEVLPSIRKSGSYTARGAGPRRDDPLSTSHRADILVSADRSFRAVMRSSRVAGLPMHESIRRAQAVTIDRTGLDMLAELGIDPARYAPPVVAVGRPVCPVALFYSEWQQGLLPLPYTVCHRSALRQGYVQWCLSQVPAFPPLAEKPYHRQLRAAAGAALAYREVAVYTDGGGHKNIKAHVPEPVQALREQQGCRAYDTQAIQRFDAALAVWLRGGGET